MHCVQGLPDGCRPGSGDPRPHRRPLSNPRRDRLHRQTRPERDQVRVQQGTPGEPHAQREDRCRIQHPPRRIRDLARDPPQQRRVPRTRKSGPDEIAAPVVFQIDRGSGAGDVSVRVPPGDVNPSRTDPDPAGGTMAAGTRGFPPDREARPATPRFPSSCRRISTASGAGLLPPPFPPRRFRCAGSSGGHTIPSRVY